MDYYNYNNSDNQNGQNNQNNPNGQNMPQYHANNKSNGLSIASLVCGILAVPGILTIWFGIIFGIAAIVLGILSRFNVGKFEGKTAAGITLGIVATIVSLLMFALFLKMINSPEFLSYLKEYMQYLQ